MREPNSVARLGLECGAIGGHRAAEDRERAPQPRSPRRARGYPGANGGRGQDPTGPRAALGEAGDRDRRPGGARYAGTKAASVGALRGGGARGARGAPPRDRDEDGRRARRDEGRGDEARPARLVRRHRVPAARVRRDLPGAARQAAHLGAADAVGAGLGGDRGRVRRAGARALRRVRAARLRRRLDRPGPPGDAARRPPGGGEDPVPRRRRGAGVGPAKRGHDRPAREGDRAGARREGGGRGAARPGHGGARLRVRGPEPAQLLARLPRPPVHLRTRRHHPALAPPGAGDRAGRGLGVRARSASWGTRSGAASARSSSGSASARSTTCSTSTPTAIPATTC